MLPLYKRLEFVLKSNMFILIPHDISDRGDVFVHRAFSETGGVSLYHSKISSPQERSLTIPEGLDSYEAKLSSDDKWTLTAVDYDGSEKHQLCRVPTIGVQSIDDVKKCTFKNIDPQRIIWYVWSPRDDRVLFAGATEREQHVSIIDNNLDAEPETVLKEVFGPGFIGWKHSDFAYLLGARPGGVQEGLMTIFNPNTKEVIAEQDSLVSFWFWPQWQHQEPIIPILAPEGTYGDLSIFNAKTAELISLEQPDGEITLCQWSLNGKMLYVGATKDGRSTVSSIDIASNEMSPVDLSIGTNYPLKVRNWNGAENLFFAHTSTAEPIDLWTYDLEKKTEKRLTNWNDPVIGTEAFPVVASQSVHYPSSYDGMTIHGFLLLPSFPPPEEGYPLIMWIHGGPINHYSDDFNAFFQILTQEGFAVFAPNFRGSTGYGEEFMKALFQKAGEADLEDVSSGADHIIKNFPINLKKVGIGGGSYGGFMTLAALAFQPDRWAAGYAAVPVADWTYQWDHGDAMFKEFIEYMWGDPVKNRDLMLKLSPISKVDDVKAPLGIFQAANDSRTPLPPVLEFANRLYARNHDLSLIIEPAAGHTSLDKYSTVRNLAARVHFFKQKLQDD